MLDGLLTFYASHHAIRAEKVLRGADFEVELIPGPKELSPNCGTALRIEYEHADAATAVLEVEKVEVDEVIRYVPRTDRFPKRRGRFARKR
jgi:hypothetical protein